MVDDAFGHWLAGFIDGEGCFWIRRDKSSWTVRFRLVLRYDDRPVLAEIARVTGLGLLRDRDHSPGNPQSGWEVHRKADQLMLVELLDLYPLRSKKARDYALWRKAVLYRATMRHRGPRRADWGPIPDLAHALTTGRRFPSSPP
jgi:hypothetical protein